jgi:hypothetical protein
MLFRSRINHYDEELWHITSVTPPTGTSASAGGGGGDDIPQHPVSGQLCFLKAPHGHHYRYWWLCDAFKK